MVPRENKNNAYSKFGWTNKEYYDILCFGQLIDKINYLHVPYDTVKGICYTNRVDAQCKKAKREYLVY